MSYQVIESQEHCQVRDEKNYKTQQGRQLPNILLTKGHCNRFVGWNIKRRNFSFMSWYTVQELTSRFDQNLVVSFQIRQLRITTSLYERLEFLKKKKSVNYHINEIIIGLIQIYNLSLSSLMLYSVHRLQCFVDEPFCMFGPLVRFQIYTDCWQSEVLRSWTV